MPAWKRNWRNRIRKKDRGTARSLSFQYGFLDAKERRGVEGALRLRKSDLQTEAREKAEKIAQLKEDSLITIEDEIISLNYISIL